MKESNSIFLEYNGDDGISHDEYGRTLEGARLGEDRKTILRFHNGVLDGDVYEDGAVVDVMPAVEKGGHVEYWRAGKLHRDNQLPAVSSKGFSEHEWWIDGVRQEPPESSEC